MLIHFSTVSVFLVENTSAEAKLLERDIIYP